MTTATSRKAAREARAATGSKPQGTADEREASRYVRDMFSRIAPRYDLLNHVLSLNLDKAWRRRAAERFRHILARDGARVLDLCCGTGDLALALEQRKSREVRKRGNAGGAAIVGADFAHPMLVRANQKQPAGGPRIEYLESDALLLPFPEGSFDLVTCAFGLRNLASYRGGLVEIRRVLRPGGEIGILEFAAPRIWPIAPLYRFYFTSILPRVGGGVSGDRTAYSYLPDSVMRFPSPEQLAAHIADSGFAEARIERWSAGIVALYTAKGR